MAFSLTADAGCEYGGGVSCYGNKAGGPKQSFLGFMLYNRFWFHRDLFGLTVGGGNTGFPTQFVCQSGVTSGETTLPAAQTACTAIGSTVWSPDLRRDESFIDMSI